jgi:hypothetical protein
VKKLRQDLVTPTAAKISAYMRSLSKARWEYYRERVARGEITAENYVYRPRGPMPPRSKAKQDLTRWENQIASARLVRFALERRKVPARQIERTMQATLSQKKQRLYLRFGGRTPKQWHAVHYGRKKADERIDTSS